MEELNLEKEREAAFDLLHRIKLEQIQRAAKCKDILSWGKLLFPDKFPLPFCDELHSYFIDIRDDEFTNTEAPRGYAKTIIKCFLIPLFQALNEVDYKHYVNVQATASKATAINIAIKEELENNELLNEVYGDQTTKGKWTEKQFVLSNGIIFTAIGTGESVRGIHYKNIRPDYIIVDDLYNDEDIHSFDQTHKKNDWFWGTLYKTMAKGKRTSLHVQGTAINKEDLLELLKTNPKVKSKTFRAIKDYATQEVLWQELATFEDLMQEKVNMGSLMFTRELQNERSSGEDSIIKANWLKWYDGRIPEGEKIVWKRLGVDPSIGRTESADFTGISLVIKTKVIDKDSSRNHFYIQNVWNEHLSINRRIQLLDSIYNGNEGIQKARIEGIAGFKDFVDEVKRRTNVPVEEVDQVKDKITNLENKSPLFENGQVFINKNIEERLKMLLVEQLTTNEPPHDDIRDGIFLCLERKLSSLELLEKMNQL